MTISEIEKIIEKYADTWTLLDKHDKDTLAIDKSIESYTPFTADEAKEAIKYFKQYLLDKDEATEIFGNEKADEFEGILQSIYQTFGCKDLMPSTKEKAANLLYYIIKDHPFNDGNKRIGAFMFVLFLYKNNVADIDPMVLALLVLLVSRSDSGEKGLLIGIINLILECK